MEAPLHWYLCRLVQRSGLDGHPSRVDINPPRPSAHKKTAPIGNQRGSCLEIGLPGEVRECLIGLRHPMNILATRHRSTLFVVGRNQFVG